MQRVGIALQSRLFRSAGAAGRDLGVDQRVVQQLLDRARDAVAIEWIGVLVAGEDEQFARFQTPAHAAIIVDVPAFPRRHIVRPEADLVEVARAVAVLRPVEHRRRRVAHQEVDGLAADVHGDIPMAFRGEPEHVQLSW